MLSCTSPASAGLFLPIYLCRPLRRLARTHRYCTGLRACGDPVGAGEPAKGPTQAQQIRGFSSFRGNLLKFLKFLLASRIECP
ncbi:MAG TPA: hypothetical protein DGQ94_00345 [Pseudomonas sp.]|nr:hypothetical protein [Pseudomonas sp.]